MSPAITSFMHEDASTVAAPFRHGESGQLHPPQHQESNCLQVTEDVMIPDLFVSFIAQRPKLSPYYDEVKKESEAWMMEICRWGEREYKKHIKADFPYFPAIWATEAGQNEFRTVVDWCNWVFDFDDLFDDGKLKENPELAREEVTALMNLMTLPNHDMYSATEHPLRYIFQTVWVRIVLRSPAGVQRRFIKSMEGFFSGLVAQVDVRFSASTPDIDTYIALRRESIGVYPCLVLVEYFNGLEIPDDVFKHPAVREIETIVADIVVLQNDILSFHKEQDMGVGHNIIHLFRQDGITQQEAYNRVNDLLKHRYRRWYIAHSEVPSLGEEIDVQIQKYLKGCQDVILANINWSFRSERYFGKDNAKVRKTRMVRLVH